MSRRKQGRPQQRKTLDSLEQENDLLVCGDCQTSFPLHDIVHFIKHKKQCCDKENLDSSACRKDVSDNDHDDKGDDNDSEVEGDDEAPSSRRSKNDDGSENEEDEVDEGAPTVNGNQDGEESTSEERERKRRKEESLHNRGREERKPLKQKQVVDAESNTTHSEPSRFVCETCRSTYTSAWGLLQHAQKEHGMKIYTSTSSSTPSGQPNAFTTPVPSNVSPINLAMTPSSRSGMDRRSVSSTGSGGSVSPFPLHAPNPFSSFRMPLDTRLQHPSSLSPFSRGPTLDYDLIMDTRLRPQFLGRGIPGLDPTAFPPVPFDRSRAVIPPGLESQYDYYSMRLKQLACSPVLHPSKPSFLNPTQSHAVPPTINPTPTKAESPSVEASSSSSPRPSSLSSALALPQKLKSCEFCGKSFRFQSNLVVHRRSHTGEKPFKCPKCPHACTQQSKLKRHMKTHSTKNQNAEGSTSPGGTPIEHKDDDLEDGDDEEEEEEEEMEEMEEEEEEEDEDMVEEEMNEEEIQVLESMRAVKREENQQDAEPGEIRHESKGLKRELSNEKLPDEDSEPSDLSMKKPKQTESLLSEVMKNSGLNSIQTYSEAFQAALAESQENEKNRETDKVSIKIEDKIEERMPQPPSPKSPKQEKESDKEAEKNYNNEHNMFFSGSGLLGKSSKNSASPASVWNATLESLSANPIESAASIYSRLSHPWFHPDSSVRLLYPGGYPPRMPPARDLTLSRENHGLNLSPTTTNSALSSTSPSLPAIFKASSNNRGSSSAGNSPTTSLLLPSNGGSNVITPLKKEHRRNDTCEYCGKIFKNCSNLTVHRRSHTGEKPYKCTLCSYACAQSSKLTRHMKTHGRHGKDVYSCKFCTMPFSVPSTLEKHMRKCVENRQARILADGGADLSSEASNGDLQESFSLSHLKSEPHLKTDAHLKAEALH